MELNYEMLKANVVKVEVLRELNMGDVMDYEEDLEAIKNNPHLKIDEEEEVVICEGAIGTFNVQPYNGWYEFKFEDGTSFDVAFEDDVELNQFIKGLEIIGPNKHFNKEGA